MADKIQIRRDTASNWTSVNPTLASGEIGFETDTTKLKVGTGSTAWTSLGYYTLGTTGYAALAGATFTGAVSGTNFTGSGTVTGATVTGTTVNASTQLQIGGTAITASAAELNYVDGVTSNIQTQINAVLPSQSGQSGQFLTTNGTAADWTAVPAPTLTATADGAITAGKPCKINASGSVSQIGSTALGINDHILKAYPTQSWDTKDYSYGVSNHSPHIITTLGMCYDNHRDQFVVVGFDTANVKCYYMIVGQIKHGVVLWQRPLKILESETQNGYTGQNNNGRAMWYDEDNDRIMMLECPTNTDKMAFGLPQDDGGYWWGSHISTGPPNITEYFGQAEFFNTEGIALGTNGDKLEVICTTFSKDHRWDNTSGDAEITQRQRQVHVNNQPQWGTSSTANFALDRTNGEVCTAGNPGGSDSEWHVSLVELGTDKSANPTLLYNSGQGTSGDKDYLKVWYLAPKKYLLTYQNSSNKAEAQVLTFSGSTPTYHTAQQMNTQDAYNTWCVPLKDGRIYVRWYHNSAFLTLDGSNNITVGTVRVDSTTDFGYTMLGSNQPDFNYGYSPVSDVAVAFNYEGLGEARGFSTTTAHSDTYIGLAQGTVSNGAQATIDIVGAVNAQQSSQTTGKKYYVHHDGTLGTEYSSVYAGLSTTANNIIVKG